ncbi:MAG: glycosyltransferase family 4 protein [bacterium]
MNEIIILSMAKGWGGAEEYLDILMSRLIARNIPHRIVVREGGEFVKRNVKRAGMVSISHGLKGFFQLRQAFSGFANPLIIHVNRYYDLIRGWYLKRPHPHSLLILYQHCYLNHPHRIPLSLADGIICISEFVKSSIAKKFPAMEKRIRVINPGIDLDLFRKTKADYRIDGPVKIGMVGRFDKNQQDLILAAVGLKKKGIPILIHLAGSGKPEEEARLHDFIAACGMREDVLFKGHIPHRSMPHFYLSMDIVASTMKREGLSLAAMEAMACGLPFVAYDAPGFNEVINHTENGILVDNDIEDFASVLQHLIESMDTRKRLGRNAAKKAREYFGIDVNIESYLNFLEDLSIRRDVSSPSSIQNVP